MWGFYRRTKVHQSARMVIDNNWSTKLQMSALFALSTWSGFRATSFCPLTSLHNATWAHCQQMCKRCARQGLKRFKEQRLGPISARLCCLFLFRRSLDEGVLPVICSFSSHKFSYLQHLYCTRCVAGHRCERLEWAHGEAWIQTSITQMIQKVKDVTERCLQDLLW